MRFVKYALWATVSWSIFDTSRKHNGQAFSSNCAPRLCNRCNHSQSPGQHMWQSQCQGPWPYSQELQNRDSGSQMFMLRIETLPALDSHRRKKKNRPHMSVHGWKESEQKPCSRTGRHFRSAALHKIFLGTWWFFLCPIFTQRTMNDWKIEQSNEHGIGLYQLLANSI